MGTLLRHGSAAQKTQYLPRIASGELRLQAFGVTEPTSGTDTTPHPHLRPARRRQIHRQRPEDLDQPRRALRPDGAARAARRRARAAARSRPTASACCWSTCARRSAHGLTIRPIRTMLNHATTELFFDNLRGAGREPDRRGGARLSLHPRRHERRAHPDRGRMHRRRALLHRAGERLRQGRARCSAGRSARTRASSSRSRAPMSRSRRRR